MDRLSNIIDLGIYRNIETGIHRNIKKATNNQENIDVYFYVTPITIRFISNNDFHSNYKKVFNHLR